MIRPLMDDGKYAKSIKNVGVYIGSDIKSANWNQFEIRKVDYDTLVVKDVNADNTQIVKAVDTLQNDVHRSLALHV